MSRVTVIVPTANRAELLEVTLRAIARQTSPELIDSVVVSENLGSRDSEAVCARFPQLPIKYILREPQLPIAEHVRTLLVGVETEFVAMVCDDDLWSPGHLASAVESLDRNPSASAHFSACVHSLSELGPVAALPGMSLLWLAAGTPPRMSEYRFCLDSVLALSWIDTPFSWSTLVARSGAASGSARALTDAPHVFYADRMLFPALAAFGDIVYDPAIDTLYRLYPGNWQSGKDPEMIGALTREAWAQIEAQAADHGVDLAALWRGYLTMMPDAMRDEVAILMQRRFSNDDLVRHGLDEWIPLVPPPPVPPPPPPKWRRVGGHFKRGLLELFERQHDDW